MRGSSLFLAFAACSAQGPNATRTFDPCEPTTIGAVDANNEQLASIDDAVAMWRSRGATALVRSDGAELNILFRDAADSIYGFYDDATATLYINERLADRTQRAVTIAHELGHALGLVHISSDERASVMNPGNVTIGPTDDDSAALATLWGTCSP